MSIDNIDDGSGTAETTGVDGGLLTVGYAVGETDPSAPSTWKNTAA